MGYIHVPSEFLLVESQPQCVAGTVVLLVLLATGSTYTVVLSIIGKYQYFAHSCTRALVRNRPVL